MEWHSDGGYLLITSQTTTIIATSLEFYCFPLIANFHSWPRSIITPIKNNNLSTE